jgi:chemotaxis protein CheX
MTSDYISPFLDGTAQMLSMMAGVECEPQPEGEGLSSYISGTIKLTGEAMGQVTLSFPRETASQLVAEMLAMDLDELDEETLRDGVGEMANIVAGNAKTRLAEAQLTFLVSLPSIVVGEDHHVTMFKGQKFLSRRIHTELGDFAIYLWLQLNGAKEEKKEEKKEE